MKLNKKAQNGFTLIEIMLVFVIMAGVMVMLLRFTTQKIDETRRDRVVLQIQEILNAAGSFYVSRGYWPVGPGPECTGKPASLQVLVDATYLPAVFKNPYAQPYSVTCMGNSNSFSVTTDVQTALEATTVANRLPVAVASGKNVIATINIPGQNLNNARAFNFGSVYRPNACVPAPKCPNPYSDSNPNGMKSQIFVVPISVSGLNDTGSAKAYPINSFTAYAYGAPGAKPGNTPVKGSDKLATCANPAIGEVCKPGADGKIEDNSRYWRVCLNVVTAKGDTKSNPDWGKDVTVLAITRCSPQTEPVGTSFDMFVP